MLVRRKKTALKRENFIALGRYRATGLMYYPQFNGNAWAGDAIDLEADPTNRFDKHAVKLKYKGVQVGWLANDEADARAAKRVISLILRQGRKVYAAYDYTRSEQVRAWQAPIVLWLEVV